MGRSVRAAAEHCGNEFATFAFRRAFEHCGAAAGRHARQGPSPAAVEGDDEGGDEDEAGSGGRTRRREIAELRK
jgi:hypothetical protein